MMRMTTRSAVVVGSATAAVLLGGGIALAFWTTNGTGDAAAAVADSAGTLTVTQVGTVEGLFPGGEPLPISVKVDNPGDAALSFSDISVILDTVSPSGCLATDFTVVDTYTATVTPTVVNPTSSTTPFDVGTIKLRETGVNQDACKGATISLALAAS